MSTNNRSSQDSRTSDIGYNFDQELLVLTLCTPKACIPTIQSTNLLDMFIVGLVLAILIKMSTNNHIY